MHGVVFSKELDPSPSPTTTGRGIDFARRHQVSSDRQRPAKLRRPKVLAWRPVDEKVEGPGVRLRKPQRRKAGVTANTVTRIENGADAKQSTMDGLQRALEVGGVEFINENGGGPGVRLRKRQQRKD